MINTETTVKELVFRNGKCYGILERGGKEMGFTLNGEIFAHMKTDDEEYNYYSNSRLLKILLQKSANISLTTRGDKNGTLFTIYDLSECFMNKMKNKNND